MTDDPLRRFGPWFYAAAAYNLAWGATMVLAPGLVLGALGLATPDTVAWQVIGMLILVYAPAYWWAARAPSRHPDLIAIATLGKTLGPLGFVWAVAAGTLPLRFGLTIVTNDLIWLPAFSLYLARQKSRDSRQLPANQSRSEPSGEEVARATPAIRCRDRHLRQLST